MSVWNQKNLGDLCEEFSNSFDSMVQQPDDLIKFIFTWNPLDAFLSKLNDTSSTHQLQYNVAQKLEDIRDFVQILVTQLGDASVTAWKVEWLKSHKENFSDVVRAVAGDDTMATAALELRAKELRIYEDSIEDIKALLTFSEKFIRTDDAAEAVREFEERNKMTGDKTVRQLCRDPADPGHVSVDDYTPIPVMTGIPERFLPFLPSIKFRLHSELFCHMLKQAAERKSYNAEDHFWDVLVHMWSDAISEWEVVCASLKSGDISLEEAKHLFSVLDRDDRWNTRCYEELLKMAMGGDTGWVEERVKQLEYLVTLQTRKRAALVLRQMKKVYAFTWNTDITRFLEENQGRTLGSLKQSVLDTSKALCDISEDDVTHLRQFCKPGCVAFVRWVQKTLGGGTTSEEIDSNIKVFMDLTVISMGDSDMDMDKVHIIHAVITGYTPLIFPITGDNKTILERCQEVFLNIRHDMELPRKLETAVQLLSWLREIHSSYTPIEKSILAELASITRKGILRMGKNVRTYNKKGVALDLDDVICLEVAEDDEQVGGGQLRFYTYSNLVDLQRRLMVVVDRVEECREEMDQFNSVMQSLERLAKTFIQLCRDGCLLFHHWAVRFFLNANTPVCCIVEFLQPEEQTKQQLKGLREMTTLEDYIAEVSNYLDTCHQHWLSYYERKRNDYDELNMFTMDQLVFLQEQLVLLESPVCSPHVFSLLSLLRRGCTVNHVLEAIKSATECEAEAQMEAGESGEEDSEVTAAKNFIHYMYQNGFSMTLAAKAYQHVKDLDEGIIWCMDHSADCFEEEDDLEQGNGGIRNLISREGTIATALRQLELEVSEREADEVRSGEEDSKVTAAKNFIHYMYQNGFSMTLAAKAYEHVKDLDEGIIWCMDHSVDCFEEEDDLEQEDGGVRTLITRQDTIATTLKQLGGTDVGKTVSDLAEQLGIIWEKFLQKVKLTGKDCLSLHDLGLVLRFLALQDDDKYNRELPASLEPGQPHLVLSPAREVLNVVTSLYMVTSSAPLPACDEVLICRHGTTFEQVRLFLRRAFSAGAVAKGKIHCLAFADHLKYDVSEKTERMMTEYVNLSVGKNYKLVVVCTAETEFNAHMTAALETYLRQSNMAVRPDEIMAYLCSKFVPPADTTLQQSAACIDPERLCVRVVQSSRPGMGKSLYKKRLVERLEVQHGNARDGRQVSVTIPLHGKAVDMEGVAATLLPHVLPLDTCTCRLIHLDISSEVQEGVDILLYNLLVLGCITDLHGQVWRRSDSDFYLVEAMPLLKHTETQEDPRQLIHPIFEVLPSIRCWSPSDSLLFLSGQNRKKKGQYDLLMDEKEFRSMVFQRPFSYLYALDQKKTPEPLADDASPVTDDQVLYLKTVISHCGLDRPSWLELYNFVSFFNKQLEDYQFSIFCSRELADYLPGFADFVLRFLTHMAKDFATRSLMMAEETVPTLTEDNENDALELTQFQMKRTWESSPHPYIFFNPDNTTMTFLGFTIDEKTLNLVDSRSGQVLEPSIMSKPLFKQLLVNNVPLNDRFDSLKRTEKLHRLYQAMGVPDADMFTRERKIIDPDDTYELTTDNAKKILAIYMRFRCSIPMIIMGETGCGKTRLVKFLCALQAPKHPNVQSVVLVKVHGGTTAEDIQRKVEKAEAVAERNQELFPDRPIYTVLFFDEANTTEAIGAIKEVMCDGTVNGKPIKRHQNLKMVAACNPYRKHSEETIKRLERAGLGYFVSTEKTTDKLGRLPMRQLVYRVEPLPRSMLPLVWDFGQLNEHVELMYIKQMVRRFERQGLLGALTTAQAERICNVLIVSQNFMRNLTDESSFVSLRDADRALKVTGWFLQQHLLLEELAERLDQAMDIETISLVLALGVCYRAGLRIKNDYDTAIAPAFGRAASEDCSDVMSPQLFSRIVESCQDILLENVDVGEQIARNQALKENVFMIVVCVELGIPLFLVGKPGSSKTLAKFIVADAMQGVYSRGDLFKTLKQIQMVSFQCSPLTTAEGVFSTFHTCARFQSSRNRDEFVAVAVLNEMGLAEDSPSMPLKALHPLLEEGCEVEEEEIGDKETTERTTKKRLVKVEQLRWQTEDVDPTNKKVAFIGISNWALDPAKINRGILVQANDPDEEELVWTARAICSSGEEGVLNYVETLLPKIAKSYLRIVDQAKTRKEFFGLRDFYSLVKMIQTIATVNKRKLTRSEFREAVQRNFGGLDVTLLDPVKIFEKTLVIDDVHWSRETDRELSCPSPLLAALYEDQLGRESRYLLLLTENYGGLRILTDNLLQNRDVVLIFGSSFPKDHVYRDLTLIKTCMETGKTVILLNLENLYASLYDVFNQYYVMFGGERYVDLGLGSHRVKCKVDRHFRLMVVAEKQTVYLRFPIPLIHRLEKQVMTLNNLLTSKQLLLAKQLHEWISHMVKNGGSSGKMNVNELIVGYHCDTVASVVLKAWQDNVQKEEITEETTEKILKECRSALLWCATPDAVVRTCDADLSELYFCQQQHDDLAQFLKAQLPQADGDNFLAQVTTHSRMLTGSEIKELESRLPDTKFTLLFLKSFDTEQQYLEQLSDFLGKREACKHRVLLIQCEDGNLIQNAQYRLQEEWSSNAPPNHHVVFIVQLPRVSYTAFCGFVGGKWTCAHVDDLRQCFLMIPTVPELQSQSPSQLLSVPDHQLKSTLIYESQPNLESASSQFQEGLVRFLLVSCVQEAVACLRDPDDGSQRAMCRIATLIYFLELKDDLSFFNGIQRMMTSVLKGREATTKDPQNWLAEDAARPDWIKKAGTFRRAWMQSLERHLVPILAGIVVHLDTNQHLDLLMEEGWVREFWLKILNDSTLCQLRYSDLLSMSTRHSQLKEFVCRSTFLSNSVTPCRLPFFWIVLDMIERPLLQASTAGSVQEVGEDNDVYTSLYNSSLGFHLRDVIRSNEDADDFMERFTSDLLHTKFALSKAQHKLLMVCMKSALGQIGVRAQITTLGQDLIQVHHVLSRAKPRLQAVLDMVTFQPHLLHHQDLSEHNTSLPKEEMTRDVLLLELLMTEMKPGHNRLHRDSGCRDWMDSFNGFAPIILRLLADVDSNQGLDYDGTGKHLLAYGAWCLERLAKIRCMWTRLFAVKLFIDYMSPLVADVDRFQVDPRRVNYNLLWAILGEKANLKTTIGLKRMDDFLKHSGTQMVQKYLGTNCNSCRVRLDGRSVKLPCHRLCDKCYTEKAQASQQCPHCHKDLPPDFSMDASRAQDREAERKLKLFQRQTSGFIMAFVSQLSFGGREPPNREAVQHIFGYVLRRTEGNVVQTRLGVMERTPVLRSSILHLLIQYREAEVMDYIAAFLQAAEQQIQQEVAMEQHVTAALTELSLLVIYCKEHLEWEKEATDESRAGGWGEAGFDRQCDYVRQLLYTAWEVLDSSPLKLPTLISLGKLRYALAACAKILNTIYTVATEVPALDSLRKDLFSRAGSVCNYRSNQWPVKYFIKYMCREYGVQAYTTLTRLQQIMNIQCLNWTKLDSITQIVGVPDRYLVCGVDYRKIRSGVLQGIGGQTTLLWQILGTVRCTPEEAAYCLLLALYRHQRSMTDAISKNLSKEETIENAKEMLKSCATLPVDQEFALCMVNNGLGEPGSFLCVAEDQSLAEQSISCILVHLLLALKAQHHQLDILAPFVTLIDQPELMKNSYLPTMPQDALMEIVEALGTPHKVWECPRGHRYLIGHCGKPMAAGRCIECGETIGAKVAFKAIEGNKEVKLEDRTQPGHVLGPAEDRSMEAVSDRGVPVASVAVLRFLTHAVLYISASRPQQKTQVSELVKPAVTVEELAPFFWRHLLKDLQVLQQVLGRCCDDVYILLHHLCHRLALRQPDGASTLLASKEERAKWEKVVSGSFIQPLLLEADNKIEAGNTLIVWDSGQGESQLLNVVFEVDEDSANTANESLQHCSAPWKYRTRITVEHFFRQFELIVQKPDTSAQTLPVLRLFYEERHHLRALHYLPQIMTLQQRVMQQLCHRLNKADMTGMTIEELFERNECTGLYELMDVFAKAWDIVKTFLTGYSCAKAEGKETRMIGFSKLLDCPTTISVSRSSPVGVLLPDTEGPGCWAYLLTHYLLVQHNHFLERYCATPLAKQRYDQVPEVPVHAVTRRHLVSYSPQTDLLPLVLAHCNYSLHLGRGDSATSTEPDYDFFGFELQLRNTLLLGKSRVQRGQHGAMEIETMSYCADTTFSRKLSRLIEKVDQVPLSFRLRRQIEEELADSLPDICQSIDNLNTAMAYLLSLKVSNDQLISTFMTETLRMQDTIHSMKAQQECYVTHVQSLWLLLCQQRASVLATHKAVKAGQTKAANGETMEDKLKSAKLQALDFGEAFDGQGDHLRRELDEQQKEELSNALRRLKPERVELLLFQIFECIMLHLMQIADAESADPDTFDLHFVISENLEFPTYAAEPEDKTQMLREDDLIHFPRSIRASQAIAAWLAVHAHLLNRRQQTRETGLDGRTLPEEFHESMMFKTDDTSQPLFCDEWQFSKTFSAKGGQLQGKDSDVILYLPEKSETVPKDSDVNSLSVLTDLKVASDTTLKQRRDLESVTVTGEDEVDRITVTTDDVANGFTVKGAICTDLKEVHKRFELDETEFIRSPVVEYFSTDVTVFEKPACILIPHFLPPDFSQCDVNVYQFHTDVAGIPRLEKLTLLKGNGQDPTYDRPVDKKVGGYYFSKNNEIHVLTHHFSGYFCTICNTVLPPPHIQLHLHGKHVQRTTRDVDLSLFIWDLRLRIIDFRKDVLHHPKHEGTFITSRILGPVSDATGLELGLNLKLPRHHKDLWEHKEYGDGEILHPPQQRVSLDLLGLFCCRDDIPPAQVDWKLQACQDPGQERWFQCCIEVGYVTKETQDDRLADNPDTLQFKPEPRKVILSVDGLEWSNEQTTSATQTNHPEENTHLHKLMQAPPSSQSAATLGAEGGAVGGYMQEYVSNLNIPHSLPGSVGYQRFPSQQTRTRQFAESGTLPTEFDTQMGFGEIGSLHNTFRENRSMQGHLDEQHLYGDPTVAWPQQRLQSLAARNERYRGGHNQRESGCTQTRNLSAYGPMSSMSQYSTQEDPRNRPSLGYCESNQGLNSLPTIININKIQSRSFDLGSVRGLASGYTSDASTIDRSDVRNERSAQRNVPSMSNHRHASERRRYDIRSHRDDDDSGEETEVLRVNSPAVSRREGEFRQLAVRNDQVYRGAGNDEGLESFQLQPPAQQTHGLSTSAGGDHPERRTEMTQEARCIAERERPDDEHTQLPQIFEEYFTWDNTCATAATESVRELRLRSPVPCSHDTPLGPGDVEEVRNETGAAADETEVLESEDLVEEREDLAES